MAPRRKLKKPVTLFCAIEYKMHDRLREIAFRQRISVASIVRSAIGEYLLRRGRDGKTTIH